MSRPVDITGLRSGKLVAVAPTEKIGSNGSRYWLTQCDCGQTRTDRKDVIARGLITDCGCVTRRQKTHGCASGGTRTPEYKSWEGAKQRCENPKNVKWSDYGGRGIRMCERWRGSFEAFLADMGTKPSAKHSLDRYPNMDGDYEPSNCRWATDTEQNRNRRNSTATPEQYGLATELVLCGWSYQEIAPHLGIKLETARSMYRRLLRDRDATLAALDAEQPMANDDGQRAEVSW